MPARQSANLHQSMPTSKLHPDKLTGFIRTDCAAAAAPNAQAALSSVHESNSQDQQSNADTCLPVIRVPSSLHELHSNMACGQIISSSTCSDTSSSSMSGSVCPAPYMPAFSRAGRQQGLVGPSPSRADAVQPVISHAAKVHCAMQPSAQQKSVLASKARGQAEKCNSSRQSADQQEAIDLPGCRPRLPTDKQHVGHSSRTKALAAARPR